MSMFDDLVHEVRVPKSTDKIFKDETLFYFDSPEYENGIYICLKYFFPINYKMLQLYHDHTGNRVFLRYTIKKHFNDKAKLNEHTKLGIGVEGGFVYPSDRYTITEHWKLVRFPEGDSLDIPTQLPGQLPSDTSHLDALKLPSVLAASITVIQCSESTLLSEERDNALAAWEDDNICLISLYAMDLHQIDNGVRIPPSGWICSKCEMKENLWLNLTDGKIFCGRRFWDGTGGNNHALKHYENTKFPLVVKLGTLTPKGGEVYSYPEDSMVTDPKLAEHLSHFGIDIMLMKKTDKTLAELEISANERLGEWLTIQESNCNLEPRYGPGMTGLRNLGNTCYMNSVVQVMFAIPYYRWYYANYLPMWCRRALKQFNDSTNSIIPFDNVGLQFAKLGQALCSGAHSWLVPENLYQLTQGQVPLLPGIQPLVFRRLMGLHSKTFLSKSQQDASEFLVYLLELLDKEANMNDVISVSNLHSQKCEISIPSLVMRFCVEERIECGLTQKVRYLSNNEFVLSIPVPMEAVKNKAELDAFEKRRMEAQQNNTCLPPDDIVRPCIPFEACLSAWAEAERIDDFKTPASQPPGQKTHAIRSNYLLNYPDYLCIQVKRFAVGPDWLPYKLDIELEFQPSLGSGDPMDFHIDLENLRKVSGPRSNEQLMPNIDEDSDTSGECIQQEPNPELVNQLMCMGFSLEACQKACNQTGNTDMELATNWIMEHLDDPTLNDPESDPVVPMKSSICNFVPNEDQMGMLMAMGLTREQAIVALKHTNNNIEVAADWALSNPDALELAVLAFMSSDSRGEDTGLGVGVTSESANSKLENKFTDGKSSIYQLFAFISHMGKSTNDGHYVTHIKRSSLAKSLPNELPIYHPGSPVCGGTDQEWIIFNDEKVSRSESPPYRHGYLYFFRRMDAPSD